VILLLITMEASNLIPDDDLAWNGYAGSQMLIMALLSWWFPVRWMSITLMAIFVSQALDTFLSGNLFGDGLWEYPVAIIFALITWSITKHGTDERG